jgi:hypothetical protein
VAVLAHQHKVPSIPGTPAPRGRAQGSRGSAAAGRAGRWLALLAGTCLALARPASAEEPSLEYKVKAAFLYNFAKFIEWPAEDTGPLTIAVLGKDPFGSALEQLVRGNTVRNRALVLKHYADVQDLEACHILFISASEAQHLGRILEQLRSAPVLTVSELPLFMELGGIIHFSLEQNKVRFQINLDAAERARLKISSKLLQSAKIYRESTGRVGSMAASGGRST